MSWLIGVSRGNARFKIYVDEVLVDLSPSDYLWMDIPRRGLMLAQTWVSIRDDLRRDVPYIEKLSDQIASFLYEEWFHEMSFTLFLTEYPFLFEDEVRFLLEEVKGNMESHSLIREMIFRSVKNYPIVHIDSTVGFQLLRIRKEMKRIISSVVDEYWLHQEERIVSDEQRLTRA